MHIKLLHKQKKSTKGLSIPSKHIQKACVSVCNTFFLIENGDTSHL